MTSDAATPPSPSRAPPPAGLVGSVISGRYKIDSLLGEGGMGAVYLAEHVLMHKRLAVKVLHAEMLRMPEVVARFEREAMAAAHIEHPNVAAATDFGKLDDGAFFLVLEYVEGTSLRDLIGDEPMPFPRALHITRQIASALARAHGLGIVHRDLKPENVMLVERDGDPDFVKVLDFGIAKVPVGEFGRQGEGRAGPVLTQLGMVYGTPEYMAPEQALGQDVDSRADLYALGVMLYEMLTGERPFDSESKVSLLGMKVTQDPPPFSAKVPELDIPLSVEGMVLRLLDREASGRFQEARDLMEAIDGVLLGEGNTVPPASHVRAAPPSSAEPPTVAAQGVMRVPASPLAELRGGNPGPWLRALLERALEYVPARVLALGAGAVAVVVAVVLLAGSRGTSAPSKQAASSQQVAPEPLQRLFASKPSEAELSSAVSSGPAALEELAARYPDDPRVLRAIARAHNAAKRTADSMKAVTRLIALDPQAVDDTEIGDAVVAAAQGLAEGADAAVALLEGAFGAKGADVLYDLATSKQLSPKISARINQALAKQDLRGHASKALQIALDLRGASRCETKRALLPRAKDEGDARLLPLLRPLMAAKGCGFLKLGDCNPCLHRDDSLLKTTIAAIEEREGK